MWRDLEELIGRLARHEYQVAEHPARELLARLSAAGPRVLERYRGGENARQLSRLLDAPQSAGRAGPAERRPAELAGQDLSVRRQLVLAIGRLAERLAARPSPAAVVPAGLRLPVSGAAARGGWLRGLQALGSPVMGVVGVTSALLPLPFAIERFSKALVAQADRLLEARRPGSMYAPEAMGALAQLEWRRRVQMADTARDTAQLTAALARRVARTEEIWRPARAAWANASMGFQYGLQSVVEPLLRHAAYISEKFAHMVDSFNGAMHTLTRAAHDVGAKIGLNLPVWELPPRLKPDETFGHFLQSLAGPWHGLAQPPRPPQERPQPPGGQGGGR